MRRYDISCANSRVGPGRDVVDSAAAAEKRGGGQQRASVVAVITRGSTHAQLHFTSLCPPRITKLVVNMLQATTTLYYTIAFINKPKHFRNLIYLPFMYSYSVIV